MHQTFIIIILLLTFHFNYGQLKINFAPPSSKTMPVIDTLHGNFLTDNYRWLEDKNNAAVINWTKEQHEYTLNYMKETQTPIKNLKELYTSYLDIDIEYPINTIGKNRFQSIIRKGDKQQKLYNVDFDNKKTLIFDAVALDSSGNTAISSTRYSYDGNICAIAIQKSGSEINDVLFIETKTGKEIYPRLENVWGFTWTKDQKGGYITVRNKEMIEKQLPLKTYYHALGSSRNEDILLGEPKDAKNSFFIYDNRYSTVTFFGEGDFIGNTLRIKKTGTTDSGKIIYSSTKHLANPEAIGNKMYILSNENAPNYRLLVGDINNPNSKNWKVLIKESETVMEDYTVTKNYIIIQDKKDLVSRLKIYDLDGNYLKDLNLPFQGSIGGFDYNRDLDSIYVSIQSYTSPLKLFESHATNIKWKLIYTTPLTVNTSNLVGGLQFFTTKKGTKIPISVIHKKGLKLNGNNPTILTAYGGFNSGIKLRFVGALYADFINRGGIVMEAGIRGGNEYGEKWHLDGMQDNKQNCFDDFIAAAEWAISKKYTNKNKLCIRGASNGGLLMGAMATQRPDLFKAIVCKVPLLDMIRYHKFLIARYWIPEYGNAENEKDYKWLIKYSPYQNIKNGLNTPTMLVTAGANDSRVDPLHAKKFVAAMQNNPSQKNPVLLWIDFNSGHGTGNQTAQTIDNAVMEYNFIMNQLGVK